MEQDEEEEQIKDGNNIKEDEDQHPPITIDNLNSKSTVSSAPLLPLPSLGQNINPTIIHSIIDAFNTSQEHHINHCLVIVTVLTVHKDHFSLTWEKVNVFYAQRVVTVILFRN